MTILIEKGANQKDPGSRDEAGLNGLREDGVEKAELLGWLPRIHALGGLRACFYPAFERWVRAVARGLRDGTILREELDETIRSLGPVYLETTILGHVFSRPYGYAGDFETIEAFYRNTVSSDPRCARWDRYVQDQAVARTVRNRRDYFKTLVKNAALQNGGRLDVLDLGSGPCRDVSEFLDENPDLDVHFTCVDQDRRAIAYAANVCARHPSRVEFVEANIFRFKSPRTYGLVWSAGVMDYLDQRSAVLFLHTALASAAPGAEVVIGNFSPDNPSRNHIEVLARWYLHHRSPRELLALGENAGLPLSGLRLGMESEGINLFLHARKVVRP